MKTMLFAGAALLAVPGLAQVATAPAPVPQDQAAPKAHTRAEVQSKVAEHFARLDANRDGFVTKAEADAQRDRRRAEITERRVERREVRREHRFEQLDTNKDGSISRAEFDTAHEHRDARVAQRGGKRMARAMHRMGGMHAFGGHMFEMADADKDGRVSLQEAQAAALRHFDTADANRDGQISREERRQLRQRLRAERRPG